MPARPRIRKTAQLLSCCALPAVLLACSDSSTEPEEESVPVVVALAVSDPAEFDSDLYTRTCLTQPGSPVSISTTCPVVQWEGYEYWALSFGDNRSSFAIHAYDQGGTLLNVVEQVGARYAYAIDVDDNAETVTFRGQSDNTVTMTWDELRDLR